METASGCTNENEQSRTTPKEYGCQESMVMVQTYFGGSGSKGIVYMFVRYITTNSRLLGDIFPGLGFDPLPTRWSQHTKLDRLEGSHSYANLSFLR